MATVPDFDSVSPVRVSVSLGTTMMSPAFALFTSLVSLPIMTYRWPRRSFLPVRAFTSSMPGSSTPEMTFMKLKRPTNGSDTVLNTKPAGSPVSSTSVSSPLARRKRPGWRGCGQ